MALLLTQLTPSRSRSNTEPIIYLSGKRGRGCGVSGEAEAGGGHPEYPRRCPHPGPSEHPQVWGSTRASTHSQGLMKSVKQFPNKTWSFLSLVYFNGGGCLFTMTLCSRQNRKCDFLKHGKSTSDLPTAEAHPSYEENHRKAPVAPSTPVPMRPEP